MFNASPEFWDQANGECIVYPTFGPDFLLFRFCPNHTAITRRLSTTSPTTTPTATALPVFVDNLFVDAVELLVNLAVGFSVGIEGKGGEVGLPLVDELLGGAGGEIAGGEEVEGTEGGGDDGNVGLGVEFVAGGGAD